jgi:hypothetical protein
MYFIYFRADPWEKEMREYEKTPPSKRAEAERAFVRLTRSGMVLPPNPLPASCSFDSIRDAASFESFVAIMKDCWYKRDVSFFKFSS